MGFDLLTCRVFVRSARVFRPTCRRRVAPGINASVASGRPARSGRRYVISNVVDLQGSLMGAGGFEPPPSRV